ncbi:hypothetical protein F2Q68_00016541 [Brassica cretica]|uniref:Uncharacterized protein n=1 Tax=Brassica cretica TaxID=69181 RepID=A0A8S9HLA0_BRACR|nr:hypothetical protein F2Q68_00016541 [Brassica cretica]
MSEEIRVSNRFGGLTVEEDMEEQVEESGNKEENKENENTINIVSGGASKETGKEFSFGKYGNRGNQQPARLGPKDKKISNMRGPNPPKTKLRNVGRMRGLVFGPISGESGLSARGKRLRVEKENVGRPDGVFAGDGELDRNEKNSGHVLKFCQNPSGLRVPRPTLSRILQQRTKPKSQPKNVKISTVQMEPNLGKFNMDKFDGLFGPTRRTGELDGAFDPTRLSVSRTVLWVWMIEPYSCFVVPDRLSESWSNLSR